MQFGRCAANDHSLLDKFSLARSPAFFLVIDFDFPNHERR